MSKLKNQGEGLKVYIDKAGKHRWKLIENGEVVAVSPSGYKQWEDMLDTLRGISNEFTGYYNKMLYERRKEEQKKLLLDPLR